MNVMKVLIVIYSVNGTTLSMSDLHFHYPIGESTHHPYPSAHIHTLTVYTHIGYLVHFTSLLQRSMRMKVQDRLLLYRNGS